MSVAIVTGSAGLIGSEAARHFAARGLHVIGIDNDTRRTLFGDEASTMANRLRLTSELGSDYEHLDCDIRDRDAVADAFRRTAKDVSIVVHTAAQPSHDWAARDPVTDFEINTGGTLNLLEATRQHAPDSVFIFTSTNKVYGDSPNALPFVELQRRFEIEPSHRYYPGITEDMSIDQCLHSVFGASKVAADVLVQEYGRYFGLRTVCFRGGTLTGPAHSATELHGFLAYVMRCAMTRRPYTVHGYQGKQVRDAIHSADLIAAFDSFFRAPRSGEVYNIGGGRHSNASVLEAIEMCEDISGEEMIWSYAEQNRIGDHVWWIGSNDKFSAHYPAWSLTYDTAAILKEIRETNLDVWHP